MADKFSKISFNTEKILYYILLSGGFIVASIIAPQLPYALLRAYLKNKKFQKFKFNRDLQRLKERGEVWITEDGIKITKKGKSRVLKYQLDDIEINKPPRWDKKWRIVIFDIPDHSREKSNYLRHKLIDLGFQQYQKSIFIHPYPCEDEIDYIKGMFEVRPYVKIFIAEKIEDEEIYKRKFDLV